MPSQSKVQFTKDQRDSLRRAAEVQALAERHPSAWIMIGRDRTTVEAVQLLHGKGILEVDERQVHFRLAPVQPFGKSLPTVGSGRECPATV